MRRLLRTIMRRVARRTHERVACRYHNRGLARFDTVLRSAGVATLSEQIEERLARNAKVRVLEIGCGEGRLLLDLLARFDRGVELHGINHPRWPVVVDARGLRATSARYGILPPERARRSTLPTLHLADAEDLSAFPVGAFDVVISQVVLAHVARKDRALEESARLLAPGGVFFHELDHLDGAPPDMLRADLPRFAIVANGAAIAATPYLEERGVRISRAHADGPEIILARYERGDGPPFRLRLRLDVEATTRLKALAPQQHPTVHLWGVRSVYTREPD